ncbi:MAG: hypothetical protein JNL70_20045 [Saprospiraceae bacterium]|nr:hypothetical protein [Saprospiraceae bacterium]
MKFEKQNIIDFIINNDLDKIFMDHMSRQTLIDSIAGIRQMQKKKGVYAVLETVDTIFYVGYGSIGYVEALVLKNLFDLNIIIDDLTLSLDYWDSNTEKLSIIKQRTANFDLLFKRNQESSYYLDRLLYMKYPEEHLRNTLLKYFDTDTK